ncbi:MAG: CRISPR-associated helicase Cas3' [Eubacterium sp.]
MFTAHIQPDTGVEQTCRQHCLNTAEYAKDDLSGIGLGKAGWFAGAVHDMGKFTADFDSYIHKSADGLSVKKGSVIHTFAAVSYILNRFHNKDNNSLSMQDICAEIFAYAAGAHHGEFDCVDPDGRLGFLHRMKKQPDYDLRAARDYFQECIGESELEDLFNAGSAELSEALQDITAKANDAREVYFYEGMFARLLLSAVIDGDRRDTAEFMAGADFSKVVSADSGLWKSLLAALEHHLDQMDSSAGIQAARRDLSDYCKDFSSCEEGIYRLDLPTGAGKTLSGLRFALAHAAKKKKKRIIYVAPLISILDQNADVIRDNLERSDIVLEHHSNIITDEMTDDELHQYELLAETWDSPIIITTLVQLLNTIFSGKTTCIRRFQSLAESVIIFDEVQTVPANMLTLFNLAMNFLAQACHATILLCSATQPSLDELEHPMEIRKEQFVPDREMERYREVFRRTKITWQGDYQFDDIPEFLNALLMDRESVLVVCNKKMQAEKLFEAVKEMNGVKTFHLSSAMCMAHRKATLEEMYQALEKHEKMICISTQVIQAGVDISFSAVVRFAAGLDSIVQAAGRCNRNGESDSPLPVYVINCADEQLKMLPSIQREKSAFLELVHEFEKNPQKYEDDLASEEAIRSYYHYLFRDINRVSGQMDFVTGKGRPSIFELLSDNGSYVQMSADPEYLQSYMTRQAFKTAGESFRVIDNEAKTVIVPYLNEGRALIAEIYSEKAEKDYRYMKSLLNQAKAYSVSVYYWQFEKLKQDGRIHQAEESIYTLDENCYDKYIGLNVEGGSEECIQIL